MKTLWNFGDSFSTPFEINAKYTNSWADKYCKFKGYTPKIAADYIAEELDFEHRFQSKNPYDNESILENIIDILDEVKEDDILLIGIAPFNRFRIIDQNSTINKWFVHNINQTVNEDHFIGEECLNKIALSKNNMLQVKYLEKISKLIKMAIPNNKVFYWHWGCMNNFIKIETILDETEGTIPDHHWSEKTHKVFAEWFIEQYKKGEFPNFFDEKLYKDFF